MLFTLFFNLFILLLDSRHVLIPKEMVSKVPKTRLMKENEWRDLGVTQSKGWVHYMQHLPGTNYIDGFYV